MLQARERLVMRYKILPPNPRGGCFGAIAWCSRRPCADIIPQHADTLDLDLTHIAVLHPGHARRGAAGDDVAGIERAHLRKPGHDLLRAEQPVGGRMALSHLAVDPALDVQIVGIEAGHDPGPERCE